MKRVSSFLADSQIDKIDRMARETGLNKSDVVRRMIDAFPEDDLRQFGRIGDDVPDRFFGRFFPGEFVQEGVAHGEPEPVEDHDLHGFGMLRRNDRR